MKDKTGFSEVHYVELNGNVLRRLTCDMIINFEEDQVVRSDYNTKLVNLLSDLIYTNEDLFEFYNMHYQLISNNIGIFENSYYTGKYYKSIISIAHDLKYTVDQIITLICLLRKESLYIDSIGALYSKKKNTEGIMQDLFSDYESYLHELNDMENSFKHHFTNGIKRIISNSDPIIYYYFCKNYSDLDCEIENREMSVDYMVTNFNMFLEFALGLLNQFRKGNES